MSSFESKQEQISEEYSLTESLLNIRSGQEAVDIITDFAEESKNTETHPMIQECINVLYNPERKEKFDDIIALTTVQELFPILYKKIITGKEKVTQEEIQDTLDSVSKAFNEGSLNEFVMQELAMSFILLNCSTNHEK